MGNWEPQGEASGAQVVCCLHRCLGLASRPSKKSQGHPELVIRGRAVELVFKVRLFTQCNSFSSGIL